MQGQSKITNAFFTILIVSLIACKAKLVGEPQKTQNKPSEKQQTAYPTEPGTCVIQGYILNILPVDNTKTDEPCKSFPCKATVIITKSNSCGFGVQRKPVAGDTLEINFIHSLAPSEEFKKVYPSKLNLSGLKLDQLFEAQIRIKLMLMDKFAYDIGSYELLK